MSELDNLHDNIRVIQISRSGVHKAAGGQHLTFTDGDLSNMAAAYNNIHNFKGTAPLQSGHGLFANHSFGRVLGLAAKKDKLYAAVLPTQEGVNMVRNGDFDSVSASFNVPPNKVASPYENAYLLHHVALLGKFNGMRPAIKGMDPVVFGESLALPAFSVAESEYVSFQEFGGNISDNKRANLHYFVTEISRTCGMDYSSAVSFAENFTRNTL